jgi:2-iminobutanoate/2-iminopropanoate deaminase
MLQERFAMVISSVNPANVPAPVGNYSHGLAVSGATRQLYISGQIPELSDGTVPEDFGAQCEAIWANIGNVLEANGMTYKNLVKVNTYLTSRDQSAENSKIRMRILGDHCPALTVIVAQTLESQWLVEMDAVAAGE